MKKLGIILCVLCFGFIFYNSSQSGSLSNLRSYKIVQSLREVKYTLEGKPNLMAEDQSVLPVRSRDEVVNLVIRKMAHASEYCLLAVLVCNGLFLLGLKGKDALAFIMVICLLFAMTDEFHQMFVSGRTPLITDVMIDFTGSLIGMGLFYFAYYNIYDRQRIKG
ncbi:MAG TPA: VanZ family protein [Clostridium sp.]